MKRKATKMHLWFSKMQIVNKKCLKASDTQNDAQVSSILGFDTQPLTFGREWNFLQLIYMNFTWICGMFPPKITQQMWGDVLKVSLSFCRICENSLKVGIKHFVIRGWCGVMVQFGPEFWSVTWSVVEGQYLAEIQLFEIWGSKKI